MSVLDAELAVQTLPDAEREVVTFLRDQPELAWLNDRVFTAYPAQAGNGPLIVVRRFGGSPIVGRPLVLDEALLQLDCYANRKEEAAKLGALVRALLAHRSKYASVGAYRYVPDETFNPPRPRELVDVTYYLRPVAPSAAARRARDARVSEPTRRPEGV